MSIDPGADYRLLHVGEMLKDTDDFLLQVTPPIWKPTSNSGYKQTDPLLTYRRKIMHDEPTTIDPPSDLLTGLITAQLKRKKGHIVLRHLDIKLAIGRDQSYDHYWNQVKDYLEQKGFTILHQLFLPEKFGGHVAFVVQYQAGMGL